MSIIILGSEIPLPFRFSARLPFDEDDKRLFPWLAEDVRYYGVEEPELNKGGRAIAYRGFLSNRDGMRVEGIPQLVLKLPNLNPDAYTADEIRAYLSRLSEEGGREWQLTRKRLYGCEYANPIFDFNVEQVTYLGELLPLPATVQLFLHDASSLDEYLLQTGQRTEKYRSTRGIPYDNWRGMTQPEKWIELVRGIAMGLADIHQRRVVHGDIWPPNVFIKVVNGKPLPIFIDFGEAFSIEPRGDSQNQRDHAYRAPERRDEQSIVTQRADVYSFGKLLLYLATGAEPLMSPQNRGHERRELVRENFESRNEGIISDNPYIFDIICKCVSLDPVDRPSMSDVLRALNSYVDSTARRRTVVSVPAMLASLETTWRKINADLEMRQMSVGPFLEEIVEDRLRELEAMMAGLANDVINLTDTRERLIVALLGLFGRMGAGDRYLSITNPRMWQGSALGLDGRYFNAAQLAVARGASVQRAFIFSVQEVGEPWARALCENLETLNHAGRYPAAGRLAANLRVEIVIYLSALQQGKVRILPDELQAEARERLSLIVQAYMRASETVCKGAFDQGAEFTRSSECKGIYFGLIPVHSLGEMRTLKSAHPVSVFYYSTAEPRDQYLLMMTDCAGRTSYAGVEDGGIGDIAFQRSKPELRGITVFKSVLGVPEDRIKKLEQQFRRSVPVGFWLDQLYAALPSIKLEDTSG